MPANFTARATVLCLLACALSPAPGWAQQRGPQGNTYASIAALPDWSGIWVLPFSDFIAESELSRNTEAPDAPKMTPAAAAIHQARVRELLSGSRAPAPPPHAGMCAAREANGMPAVMRYAFGVEFLFTPGRVTILLEQGSMMRRIYTDGRTHDKDAEATRTGESIGYWDGDTLVVDTIAISPGNALLTTVPTTTGTRVVERLRKIDATHLQIDTVLDDGTMLREPWRRRRVYERSAFGWFDRTCTNDRDGIDQEPDLTPPR